MKADKLLGYANTRGKQFMPLYAAAAQKHGVPVGLLVAQGAQESGYWDPAVVSGKRVSSAGALGVGQFMPGTAERFGIDPLDPAQAIDAQAKYMRLNADMFDGDWSKALAAYNWGEGNVQKKGLGRMPAETRNYLSTIMPYAGGAVPSAAPQAAPQAGGFDASKYGPPSAAAPQAESAPQASSFDASKYGPPSAATPQAGGFDASKYGPPKLPTNAVEAKAQAYSEQYGVPYEQAKRIFDMEAKQNAAIDAEREQLKSSTVFGNEALGGFVAGVNEAVGNVGALFTDDNQPKSVADTLDFLHEKSGGTYDVAKFAGQVAPMLAVPVMRAAPAATSKLLPQVAESTLTRGMRYLGNAALQSGSAYTFMPEESRGSAASLAGALALGLPIAGKVVQGVGAIGRGVGSSTAKMGKQAAILSPEVATGRQLYYGLGADGVNDVTRAATQAQDDLASTLASVSRNSTKPLSKEAIDVAERMAIGAPNYASQTASELNNLVTIARQVLDGTLPANQFAATQAANTVGSQIALKVPGMQVARHFMPDVAETYLGRAMAEKLVAAANNPIELARLLEAAHKLPGWSKFIQASGNAVANAGSAVANAGGYMTRYGPPMAAPTTAAALSD